MIFIGNPTFSRFLKAGFPIKAFGYYKSIMYDERLSNS
uniref:Uncharacterized protein n=1 Tax=uncultured Desulfobacterium sp. TaxID=201089 RepID=E1Y829_9BACT|nr:unknown protein [uncultured Desulfobacterium sp.]CBX27277.1 unknown protein [uncultured Desulfobacterium sp.]CBX28835.1 unknown protein [uncultured Desulfobacterium sp.]CBX30260.1 unknown protein [uncultured Desulfobacterium sp.]CBX31174.1 unknown protein [uncultured Desulfobacterium sp.]